MWGELGFKAQQSHSRAHVPSCHTFVSFFSSTPLSFLTSTTIDHIIYVTYHLITISSPITCCLDYCSILLTGFSASYFTSPSCPYFSLGSMGLIMVLFCSNTLVDPHCLLKQATAEHPRPPCLTSGLWNPSLLFCGS